VIYNRFDVVRVPFPFTDKTATKRRPVLVISDEAGFNTPSGHCVLAMITSAKHSVWPLDTPIRQLDKVGLKADSIVRLKQFTLDPTLILGTLGQLAAEDA